MAKKKDRRLIVCAECEEAYPGFRAASGDLKIVGGPVCPNCGGNDFAEVEIEIETEADVDG